MEKVSAPDYNSSIRSHGTQGSLGRLGRGNLASCLGEFCTAGSQVFSVLLQFTMKIPRQTKGNPTIKELVNSSPSSAIPNKTPKMGVKKVKAVSLLTEYSWINLNQMTKEMKALMTD